MMKDIKRFCIQIADTFVRRKHRGIEHRKFIRLKDSISLAMRLVDCNTGKIFSKQINGRTVNISREGLCIETSTVTVDGVDIFNGAMSDEKNLEIEIDANQGKNKIIALGKVIWLDMTPKQKSFLFKAGVSLTIQEKTDLDRWYHLVESAKKSGKGETSFMHRMKNFFRSNP